MFLFSILIFCDPCMLLMCFYIFMHMSFDIIILTCWWCCLCCSGLQSSAAAVSPLGSGPWWDVWKNTSARLGSLELGGFLWVLPHCSSRQLVLAIPAVFTSSPSPAVAIEKVGQSLAGRSSLCLKESTPSSTGYTQDWGLFPILEVTNCFGEIIK